MSQIRGKFIVIEGTDGAGISTQSGRLRDWIEEKLGVEVVLTKEPSEGPAGADIRLVLAKRLNGLDPLTLLYYFATDRSDHTARDIRPKLEMGVNVVCDRYYLSNYAYQSSDIDLDIIKTVNSFITIEPDLTIFLDVPTPIAIKRIASKRWERQLYEDDEIRLAEVRERFLNIIKDMAIAGHNIHVVDGTRSIHEVSRNINSLVRSLFSKSTQTSIEQLTLPS